MGHRSFRDKASKNTNCTESEPRAEPKTSQHCTMNGLRKVTQEQQDQVVALRRKLRDEVSAKMGNLLLKGYTMLNEYCNVCAGIMMEDRQGSKECVTCESMNAELGPTPSRLVAEIPLDASDDIYENLPSALDQDRRSSRGEEGVEESLERLGQLKDKARKDLYAMGSERYGEEEDAAGDGPSVKLCKQVFKHKKLSSKTLTNPPQGVNKALSAVSIKLNWCTERLMVTEDIEEIIMLHKAIDGAINILKAHSLNTQ